MISLRSPISARSVMVSLSRHASYMHRKKNYYEVLGVQTDATANEIKAAFVKKSNELHPDRNRDPGDSRVGWSRENPTEKFMQVKEAYDCLRKADRRKNYDQEVLLAPGGGFLMEAKTKRFRNTIVDLNKKRNESYVGPSKKSESAAHFRDPEKEYEQERKKNRSLYMIGGVFVFAIVANIAYVTYLQKSGKKKA